jgi:enolase
MRRAIRNVTDVIQPALIGMEVGTQAQVDRALIDLDGAKDKSKLGANAILGVSLGVAKACAVEKKMPLYRHLAARRQYTLPVPMFNVLNGGRHADNNVDFQEFMIVPVGLPSFGEALRAAAETFAAIRAVLLKRGCETGVGDEGGFSPRLQSNSEAMEVLIRAIDKSGYKAGKDIAIFLDPAASEFHRDDRYVFGKSSGERRTFGEMIDFWSDWIRQYPMIWSIEDGLAEDDWNGWKEMTAKLGSRLQLVGDDIFVTNPGLLTQGIREGVGNSILIKLNQIGTLTETLACIELAQKNGYTTVISHRSGETDDSTIADLAVATGAGQIKAGTVCRGERVAKYNRLLEIEHELGASAAYAGAAIFERWMD